MGLPKVREEILALPGPKKKGASQLGYPASWADVCISIGIARDCRQQAVSWVSPQPDSTLCSQHSAHQALFRNFACKNLAHICEIDYYISHNLINPHLVLRLSL